MSSSTPALRQILWSSRRVDRGGPVHALTRQVLFHPKRHFAGAPVKNADGKKPSLGFIGLGKMGFHMAFNLSKKSGLPLVAYDASSKALDRFLAATASSGQNVMIGKSPADVAARSEVLVSMLPAAKHVLEVYQGRDGVLEGLQPGSLVIESSTIDPEVAESVIGKVSEMGAVAVDAPVSGGTQGSQAGTLTFMVGANNDADFELAKIYLAHMGKNIIHCGGPGKGQITKICNNMLLGISMIATSEAMNLGVKMGLEPKLLASILNTSSGRCWSSEIYNPHPGVVPTAPSSRDYEDGFGMSLMAKDMGLATAAATKCKSTILLGSLSQQLYSHLSNQKDYEKKDFSSVYRWISGDAGKEGRT